MAIATINPATGETLRTFEPLSEAEIEQRLSLAVAAFREHRRTSFAERAQPMMRAAELLEAEKQALARMMTVEMGKPLKAAGEEVSKCA
jgi:succinate-semialdehyde dehydrogenase / glutarate-semialdehyde dehydrogenase